MHFNSLDNRSCGKLLSLRLLARIGVVAIALVAVTVLAAVIVVWLRFPLGTRLRSEVARDAHRTWPRPAFGEEVEGVFSTLAAPGLPQLEWHPDGLGCVALSNRGAGPIDDECRGWVANHWPATAIVLAATHARLGSWDVRTLEDQGDATEGTILAARVASVHMLLDLEHHDSSAAVNTCLETLALGRDDIVTGTMLGTSMGSRVVQAAFPTCAVVLDAAPDKLGPSRAIGAIENGLPPVSRMFHTEALCLAASLEARLKACWPPTAFFDVYSLLESVTSFEADARIADEPEPARSADIQRNDGFLNKLSDHPYGTTVDFVHRDEAMRARLRILRELGKIEEAQARTGTWPAVPAPLTLTADEPSSRIARLRDPSSPFGPESTDPLVVPALEVALHAAEHSPMR